MGANPMTVPSQPTPGPADLDAILREGPWIHRSARACGLGVHPDVANLLHVRRPPEASGGTFRP